MHTLKLQEKQNEMAIDARLEKLKYLKDDNTFEEVKRFFIKFDALVKDKTDEEKMEQLELKVSGRAQFLFKNARKERRSYSFTKENILEMTEKSQVSQLVAMNTLESKPQQKDDESI
jgi:hypothetical protein